jgi:hypothetical protein
MAPALRNRGSRNGLSARSPTRTDDRHPLCQARRNAASSPIRNPGELAWNSTQQLSAKHPKRYQKQLVLESVLYINIIFKREVAVMIGEDTDRQGTTHSQDLVKRAPL